MNLSEFYNLPFDDKWDLIISDQGLKLIPIREYYNQKVVLWDYGKFFIETYHLTTEKEVTKIEGSGLDDKRLDLYIDYINKHKFDKIDRIIKVVKVPLTLLFRSK